MRGAILSGLGAIAAILLALPASETAARELGGAVTMTGPAGTLLMPFDNTEQHVSFQTVTLVGAAFSSVIVTHWSYWSEDCRPLADVVLCLTERDTKVMDSTRVQGETQYPSPPRNVATGSPTDLTGERGIVTVTAFETNFGNLPLSCGTVSDVALPRRLFGGWVIADTSTNAAFGADAIGLAPNTLPDADLLGPGIHVPTFNPERLDDSAIILLSAETSRGVPGLLAGSEIGPIQRARADGAHVCCAVELTDHLEMTTSLPDLCFGGAAFRSISALQAGAGVPPVVPPNASISAPGVLRVYACETATGDGALAPLGAVSEQFLFAIHGQAIGPFGTTIHGKYSRTASDR